MRYVFLIANSVSLPRGSHGGIIEAEYRLVDDQGRVPRGRIRVTERHRVLADPYRVARVFRLGTYDAQNGKFGDRYALISPEPLPDDFRFEVEQHYFAGGAEVTGKNKIVYLPDSVLLYVEENGRLRLRGRGSTVR